MEGPEIKSDKKIDVEVPIRRILVPLDGSDCSIRAAKYAIEVARLQWATIFCIHVITRIPYGYSLPGSSVDEYFENVRDKAQAWFSNVIYMATKVWAQNSNDVPEIKTDVFRNVDSVPDAIIDYAEKNKMDLVVIGTKGRTGLKRFLLGSVAQGVVQHAHCPVLIVR